MHSRINSRPCLIDQHNKKKLQKGQCPRTFSMRSYNLNFTNLHAKLELT